MEDSGGKPRVLHFGNLEDIIFCKAAACRVIQKQINEILNLWEEYDNGWDERVPDTDPYIKDLDFRIYLLEKERKLILAEIRAFEAEKAFEKDHTSSNNPA